MKGDLLSTLNIFCKFIPQKFGGFKKVVPLHPPLIHLTLLAFFIITLTGCCIEWNTSDFHTLAWWSIGAIFARNAFSYGLWRWQRNWQYAKRLTNNRVWLPSLVSLYRRLVLRNRLSIDAKQLKSVSGSSIFITTVWHCYHRKIVFAQFWQCPFSIAFFCNLYWFFKQKRVFRFYYSYACLLYTSPSPRD
mgnify:CR=1 FL=1